MPPPLKNTPALYTPLIPIAPVSDIVCAGAGEEGRAVCLLAENVPSLPPPGRSHH
ncbi:hypothetical protein [Methanocalculus sp. MC3]